VKSPSRPIRVAAACLLALLSAGAAPRSGRAEETAPTVQTAPTPSAPTGAPTQPSSASPGAQTPAPSSPAPAPAPAAGQPPPPQPPGAPAPSGAVQQPSEGASPGGAKPSDGPPGGEVSTGETVVLNSRPFAYIEGKADRDEVYGAIQGSLGLVKRELDKAGLKPAGRPIAVFVESDETGFRYRAGYPVETVPDGKTSLSEAVKVGATPGGKSMRFQHLGAYADIDSTYDAVTAYLDEKGIDAQDSFVEEYANDVKDGDDPNLEVNIYVLLK
jgi:effector-binding domain-containing protein